MMRDHKTANQELVIDQDMHRLLNKFMAGVWKHLICIDQHEAESKCDELEQMAVQLENAAQELRLAAAACSNQEELASLQTDPSEADVPEDELAGKKVNLTSIYI